MSTKTPENKSQFQKLMEEIDQELRDEGVPIPARQMKSLSLLAVKLQQDLFFPPQKDEATPGSFSGEDLVIRTLDWFEDRYGEALVMNFGPGKMALLIKSDIWIAQFPRIYGRRLLICSNDISPNATRSSSLPLINVLNHIEMFPDGLRNSLTNEEMDEILATYTFGLEAFQYLKKVNGLKFVPEALSDYEAAVQHVSNRPPHFGQASWSALQATEKLFKAYIAECGEQFAYTHDLGRLYDSARTLGFQLADEALLESVQCSADVRYGEIEVDKFDAIAAHHASIKIGGAIARTLLKVIQPS